MEEVLRDFLTESSDQAASVSAQLARLSSGRLDDAVLADVSRLIHTLKGASGFLNLPRLERISDAAALAAPRLCEREMRGCDAAPLLRATVDRIKVIVDGLRDQRREPAGDDADLLSALRQAGDAAEAAAPESAPPFAEPAGAPAVIVVCAGERIAVPRAAVVRVFEIGPAAERPAPPKPLAVVETPEGVIPIARLDVLATGREGSLEPRVVVQIEVESLRFAILVDDVVGFQDIVVGALPSVLRGLSIYAGVAALADDAAVMVLNPAGIAAALEDARSERGRASVCSGSRVVALRAGADTADPAPPPPSNPAENPPTPGALPGPRLDPAAGRPASPVLLLQDKVRRAATARPGAPDGGSWAENATLAGTAPTQLLKPTVLLDHRQRRRRMDGPPKRQGILIIEPEAYFRAAFVETLTRRGFEVCALSAPDGALAPDGLVGALIDVDIAAADGGAWVRGFRRGRPGWQAPPLFGLAAYAGPAARRRASALGLACVFAKFDRQGIFAALAMAEPPVAPEKAA